MINFPVHIPLADVKLVLQKQDQPVFSILGVLHGLHIRMLGADAGNQPGKERLHRLLVPHSGIPDLQEQPVALRRERDGRQRLSDLAGKHFLEEGHVLFVFRFVQGGHRNGKTRNGISDMINIAAAEQGGIPFVRVQPPSDF